MEDKFFGCSSPEAESIAGSASIGKGYIESYIQMLREVTNCLSHFPFDLNRKFELTIQNDPDRPSVQLKLRFLDEKIEDKKKPDILKGFKCYENG